MSASLLVLLSGCMKSNECDWARTIPFGSAQSIEWLIANDRDLVVAVVTHNETRQEVCK